MPFIKGVEKRSVEEQEMDELYAPVADPRVILRILRCRATQGRAGTKPRRLSLRLIRKSRPGSSSPSLVSSSRKSKSGPSSL